jgi:MarR family transcriptional regulator, organic hydroperoxide resistance regulator
MEERKGMTSRPPKKARKMSLAEEAVISVYRTNEFLRHQAAPIFETEGITAQQYNVLRILRGAGAGGLSTQELGARMVQNTPGVTRLLDRLESKHLVKRRRPDTDRRVQLCSITGVGSDLLKALDPKARQSADNAMSALSNEEAITLMRLLERIRGDASSS